MLSRLFVLATLAISLVLGPPVHAGQAQSQLVAQRSTLSVSAVRAATRAYAKRRGIRPEDIDVQVLGRTDSGKSTRAAVTMGGMTIELAVNHGTDRVQARNTADFVSALVRAHQPLARVANGEDTRFANMLVDFRPGRGAELLRPLGSVRSAPFGRPRAGQTQAELALDALSLGERGSVTVSTGKTIIAGRPNAAVRVRENGIADKTGTIINQTPGLVEVMAGNTWYRLGYAGYQAAGDVLSLANALDKIPDGATVSLVRVTDAPNAPHPRGIDPTDNAVAQSRGVKGFDLVSVEMM